MSIPPAVRRETIAAIVWFVIMIAGCLLIGLCCSGNHRWNVAD